MLISVLALVQPAQMCVEGEMLDLLLCQVFFIVWFERHAVVAHSLWPMSAHPVIFWSCNLAILLVQLVVYGQLFHSLPGILDEGRDDIGGYGDTNIIILSDRVAVEAVRCFRVSVGVCSLLLIAEEYLGAMAVGSCQSSFQTAKASTSHSRHSQSLESYSFQCFDGPCIRSVRLRAHRDRRRKDIFRELLQHLRKDRCDICLWLECQPELTVRTLKSEYHRRRATMCCCLVHGISPKCAASQAER